MDTPLRAERGLVDNPSGQVSFWQRLRRAVWTVPNGGLLGLTILFGVIALLLGRAPAGPPPVPEGPSLQVVTVDRPPANFEVMARMEEGATHRVTLQVFLEGKYKKAKLVPWDVVVTGLAAGSICQPPHDQGCTVPAMRRFKVQFVAQAGSLPAFWDVSGTSRPARGPSGFAEVIINWTRGSPIRTSGAYLSALLPAVTSTLSGTVVRELSIPESFFDYTLEGGESPTGSFATGWLWSDPLS